jgi:hypothetical protein
MAKTKKFQKDLFCKKWNHASLGSLPILARGLNYYTHTTNSSHPPTYSLHNTYIPCRTPLDQHCTTTTTATTTYLHFCPLSLTHKHTHHTNHQAGLTHTTHTNTKPFYTCTQALHCTALHCTTLHLHTHLTLSLLISLSHSLSPTTPTTPTSTPTPSHPSIHHISYITSWLSCLHLLGGIFCTSMQSSQPAGFLLWRNSASWLKLCFRGSHPNTGRVKGGW